MQIAIADPPRLQIGRTEVCRNTNDPDFATPIELLYMFEAVQNIRLDMCVWLHCSHHTR